MLTRAKNFSVKILTSILEHTQHYFWQINISTLTNL